MLAETKKLILAGCFDEARASLRRMLEQYPGKVDIATSLGIPRRLQSAMLKLAKAEGDAKSKIAYQFHLVPSPEILRPFGRFSAEERQEMVRLSREPVPRQLHQVWLGARPVPPAVAVWAQHALDHGYRHRLWREEDLVASGYDRHPALRQMLERDDFPGAVDVARYLILRDHGGIYLDCDWYPGRTSASFHDFLPTAGLCVFAEEIPRNTGSGGTLFANSFIAVPPGHPAFTRLCDVLTEVTARLDDAPAWWSTGPLIFTVVTRGGPVCLADSSFVAPSLPKDTPFQEVASMAGASERDGGALLIPWKSW